MSDNLERLAGRARDDLTRAVDAAAGPPPPVAAVARRAARRRATHVALAVAAVLSVGSTAVWSQAGGDGPTSNVVAGQPDSPGAAHPDTPGTAHPDPAPDTPDTQPAQPPLDRTEDSQEHPKDPRPCSPAEFPVTVRSTQEDYSGDEAVRIVYEFTNRSSSPCIFPHHSTIRFKNEAGEVVLQSMTTHDCPNEDCRHIPPGATRTGGEEWAGTIPGPASEPVRAPDGLYHAELDFEVEDSESPQAEPLARYHVVTAPFRIRSD